MKRVIAAAFVFLFLLFITTYNKAPSKEPTPLNAESEAAAEITAQTNAKVYQLLDSDNEQEAEFAGHGFTFAPDSLIIQAENDTTIWSQDAYDFVRESGDAPTSINPSLWRNMQYNARYGLFEITGGVYQVRGYDTSNTTSVRSENGWTVMDCDSGRYTASEALKFFRKQTDDDRIVAVIISHAHADHYSSIEGLVSIEDVTDASLPLDEQTTSGKTVIVVPQSFVDAVMKEDALVGTAMGRRTIYQYGSFLSYCEQGRFSASIGLTIVQSGTDYFASTYEITDTPFETEINGVKVVLQPMPGTESPAEMSTCLPNKQALWTAEDRTGTMHNLYTLRGVEVRDANDRTRYITQAQTLFSDAEVVFQPHNWPYWGVDVVQEYLTDTAVAYKFIHDQILLYINRGYTAMEIAATIELSEALDRVWYTRQYYGTLRHNVRTVYQKYMGWHDTNPAHLNGLEPSEYAKKLVKYLDDPEKVLEQTRADYEKGEYQRVVQITNTLVFADSENMDARYLCADTLEQLGYQVEPDVWRNTYLAATYEPQGGTGSCPQVDNIDAGTMAQDTDAQTMLDCMGITLDTEKLADTSFTIRLKLTDGKDYFLGLHYGVLLYYEDDGAAEADSTLSTIRTGILAIASSDQENIARLVTTESGDMTLFKDLCTSMTTPGLYFNIIKP